jgi:TetR/AcrR family transcriptional regulator, cholesterol catabolism regulator
MDRKEQILETAERLFSERGYHATSMRDIAAALDLKGGSLYSHIKGKEELLWWSLERAASQFQGVKEQFDGGNLPAMERLRGAIRAHIRIVANNLPAATVYFHEWRFLPEGAERESFLARRNLYETWMRQLVDAARSEGHFAPSVESKWAALLILSASNWLYQWYNPQGQLSSDDIADRFTDLIFNGLTHGTTPLPVPAGSVTIAGGLQ